MHYLYRVSTLLNFELMRRDLFFLTNCFCALYWSNKYIKDIIFFAGGRPLGVLKDNRAFFNECYRNNYKQIYNYILSKTGNTHNSEDLCQEVFARFLEHIEKIHPAAVRTWLYSAVKNVLYEHYRNSAGISAENIEDASVVRDESLSYNHPDYDLSIILDEIRRALPPDELAIYECSSIGRYTDSEAARILGLTIRQFRYRAYLVRRKIQLRLQKAGIDDPLEPLIFFIGINFFCQLCLLTTY